MNLKTWKKINNIKLVFRHQSPFEINLLKPPSYEELRKSRGLDMPKKELNKYLEDRVKEEQKYHSLLKDYPKTCSFLYATIVGYHKMESPKSYPGFTYYFSLSDEQVEQCIFHVIADENITPPKKGMLGLNQALEFWKENKDDLEPSSDEWFEEGIDPRIEVVIPFSIRPFGYIPEEEQR